MSSRPQRQGGPPERLQNQQARNVAEAADRAKGRQKKKRTPAPTTVAPSRRNPSSNMNVNPKSKLLNTLARLRNKEAPSNGLNRHGYTFLASLYRNHPSTQLKKYAFNLTNDKQIEFMKKQHRTLVKNTSRLNAPSETVNIKMDDEKMHDLLVMLWMDMSHDKLFKGTFNTFLNSSIKNEITAIKITPKNTELVKKLIRYDMLKISNGAIVLRSDIEKKQKIHMHEIWGDQSYPPKIIKKTAGILSIVRNKSKPIYVSYDAENADYVTELLAKSRMNNGTYYLKRVFTVANLMDPGRGASVDVGGFGRAGGSVNKLINRLFDEENTSTPFKFNYQMFKFNFGKYFTVEIIPDGYKFNAKLNDKKMKMQVKRVEAINGNAVDKISKTFGDFIQIITVAHLRKSGINVVSSTQDGGFVGMTGYVQGTLFEIEPALISDSTTVIGTGNRSETGIKFYGLHNYLKYNEEPSRSGVTTQVNNNNNVTKPNVNSVNQNPNKKANNNVNAKLAAMIMTQTTSPKPNNAAKSNKNLAQALANSKKLTNKWQSLKKNVLARRNKIRNNFRVVVSAAVKQNKNKKEVERKARENAENELSRLRVALEEAQKKAENAQKEVENQRRKNIKRKRVDTLLNINNSRRTRSRP